MDHRSDLYCVGIMVFELLTLRRLFPVWDVAEMRMVFEAGPVPQPSSLNPALPKDVDSVVMKALAQKASDRWQNAADFEEALRTAIAKSGIAVTASGLAKEVQAIDDAPGAKAPKTSPPASADVAPGDLAATANETPRPVTQQQQEQQKPPPQPTTQQQRSGPRTQPMPVPTQAPAVVDADHSFVISLAEQKPAPQPLAPLPAPATAASAKEMMAHPRTQVLAKNERIEWGANIGDDAELLAIARAVGGAPGQGRRTLLMAAGVGAVALVVAFAFFGEEIRGAVARALSGKQQELGTIVVKTRPAPDDVLLDGKSRGPGNKKIANVDINDPHELVVKPKGQPAITKSLTRADFDNGVDGQPTFMLEKDYLAPVDLPTSPK